MKFNIKMSLLLCVIAAAGLSLSGCGIDGASESSAEAASQTTLSFIVTTPPETTTTVPVSEPEISAQDTAEWLTKNVWNETLSQIKLYTSSGTDSGVIQIVPEKLMESLEKVMNEKDAYASAMESLKEAEPELYSLWGAVDKELSAVYENVKGKELKGDGSEPVDVSGFAKSFLEFYEAAYSGGESHTDTSVSTDVTSVSESGTASASQSTSTSKPVTTTAVKTSPTVTTPKSTSSATVSTLYKKYSSEKTMYVSSAVNVRSKPTTDSEKLGTLSAGSKITVIGESGNWYAISFTGGKTAFLSKNYVSSSKPATTTAKSVQTTTKVQAATTAVKTTTKAPSTTTTRVTTTLSEADIIENEVLRLVNIERAKVGAAPLTMDSSLCKAADVRVKEIGKSFSHTRPDGTLEDLFDELSIPWSCCAENIAKGHTTANDVMYLNEDYGKGWMYSDGHRGNILRSDFTKIGIAFDPETKCWVQVFTG